MSVVVTVLCDQEACSAYGMVDLKPDGFDDTVMVSDGRFLVETSWLQIPDGWALDKTGHALCPSCAYIRHLTVGAPE